MLVLNQEDPGTFSVGLALLNLGILMASNRAKAAGVPLRSMWLDARSHRNLKDLAESIIMALFAGGNTVRWECLTERCLEKRFGRIRTSFPNSIMAASDYWRASATCMRRERRKAENDFPAQKDPEEELSTNDFCATAQRAWQAALKLCSFSSGITPEQLQADFNHSNSGAMCEAEIEADPCPEDAGTGCLKFWAFIDRSIH